MAMLLHFQIDPRSGVPVYRQMMDQIKYYVAAGTLKPGDQLPSIRELAERLTINPTTVVKVYNELAHEDVIEMRHGKGAFVTALARRMSPGDRENALRRLARQLALESSQMRAPRAQVLRVVEEEMDALQMESGASETPVKVSVMPRK